MGGNSHIGVGPPFSDTELGSVTDGVSCRLGAIYGMGAQCRYPVDEQEGIQGCWCGRDGCDFIDERLEVVVLHELLRRIDAAVGPHGNIYLLRHMVFWFCIEDYS